jgi:hypothetical protein
VLLGSHHLRPLGAIRPPRSEALQNRKSPVHCADFFRQQRTELLYHFTSAMSTSMSGLGSGSP